MKRYDAADYLYVSAYLKCLEKYLLTREKVEKMLESKTPGDALKVLYELNYGSVLDELPAAEYETLLSRELEKTYALVASLAPEPEYLMIFLYPNDYHNIKALLKAELAGVSADDFLTGAGSVPLPDLASLVRERNYPSMREEMAKGIREAIELYGATGDPQSIDLICDKACYREINIEAAKTGHAFVRGYVRLRIDTINLKSFVRARDMGKPRNFFTKVYIDGGDIPEQLFLSCYKETPEQFADKLKIYGLDTLLLESVKMMEKAGLYTALEKQCENLLTEYMRKTKFIAYGIETLFSYVSARESDVRTARLIMAGKLANIEPGVIRERLRDTYA